MWESEPAHDPHTAMASRPLTRLDPAAPAASEVSRPAGAGLVGTPAIFGILAAGITMIVLLLYALWVFWPIAPHDGTPPPGDQVNTVRYLGVDVSLSNEVRIFVIVALAGALGGALHVLRSLGWYVGNRRLRWSWMVFYLLLPLVGATGATIFYVVLRAGLFSPSTTSEQVSPYGFAAIAALVGMFSEQAMEKLRDIFNSALTAPPEGRDHQPRVNPATRVPVAITGPPRDVGRETATLTGILIPSGIATTWQFQYGETADYGTVTPEQSVLPGEGRQEVAAVVAHLRPGTTYHFRLSALNEAGHGAGDDVTFTTSA